MSKSFHLFSSIPAFILLAISLSVQAQDKSEVAADTFNIKSHSFVLPVAHQKGYTHAVFLLYVVPPKDWTLDAVSAPMFNYTGKYSLPKGFNIQGGLSSLFISNRFFAGPFWNRSFNNFSVGVGYQLVYNLGFLNQFGFKTVLTGWEQQPSLAAGYNFGKTAVTLRGDLYLTNTITFSEAGNDITNANPFTNGWSVNISFEQRITENRVMSLGFKLYYLRYHIVAWPALPVNSYRYYMPEFQIGYKFDKKKK